MKMSTMRTTAPIMAARSEGSMKGEASEEPVLGEGFRVSHRRVRQIPYKTTNTQLTSLVACYNENQFYQKAQKIYAPHCKAPFMLAILFI